MRYQLVCFLVLVGYAVSLESAALPLLPLQHVEAEHVDFENKTLHLVGHVKVVHEIGTLYCDESTLILPQEKGEEGAVAVQTIFVKGNVIVDFSDGSHLQADEGEIDCQLLEGTFIAHPPGKVVYCSFATTEHQRIPVRATGRALKAKITKTTAGYSLTSMRGEGAVNIEYTRPSSIAHAPHETAEGKDGESSS